MVPDAVKKGGVRSTKLEGRKGEGSELDGTVRVASPGRETSEGVEGEAVDLYDGVDDEMRHG